MAGLRLLPGRTQALAVAAWTVFGAAVVIATRPVWRLLIFGNNPTLKDLLQLRCLPWRQRWIRAASLDRLTTASLFALP